MKLELVQQILQGEKFFPKYMESFLKGYDEVSGVYGEFSKQHIEYVKGMCDNGYLGAMLFCKFFLSRMFFCDFGVVHENMFNRLVNGGEFEGVAFPRESGKTSVTRGFLLWGLITKWKEFFLYVGNTDEAIRKNMLWLSNEVEENRMIKIFYGELYSDKKWSEREFELKNGAYIAAMSRGKSARGLLRDTRPEFVLIDDFEDDESANSMEQSDKADNWLFNNLIPAKSKFNGRVFIIGTIISEIGVLNRLIQNPTWKIDVCSIFLTDDKGQEIYDEDDKEIPFCPEIWSYEKAIAKRNALFGAVPIPKHQTWYSEYMNMPTNTAKRGWKMEDIQFWDGYYEEGYLNTEKGKFKATCYTAVDLASLRSGTDFTCVTTWCVDKDNNVYELKTWRQIHTKTVDIIQEIFNQHREFLTKEVYIELISCQDLILDSYDDRAAIEPSSPFLVEIRKRSQSKSDRIRGALQGKIHAKKVFLKKNHCPETYIELEKFDPTNKKQNDDILDCMADIFTNGEYIEYDTIIEKKSFSLDDLDMFKSNEQSDTNNPVRRMVDY
jgi:hypothetical protein